MRVYVAKNGTIIEKSGSDDCLNTMEIMAEGALQEVLAVLFWMFAMSNGEKVFIDESS